MDVAGAAERARIAYLRDPVAFARDVLGLDPWGAQCDVMMSVARHRRVAVRSGHKVGKTTLAAAIALWYWSLVPRARVVLTAPTWRQIQEAVWHEVKRLYRRARVPLGGDLAESVGTGLRGPDGRQCFGFAARNADAFSGISGPAVMYIVDEAAGVPDSIFEALEGASAARSARLLLGNPTSQSGEFWRAFHRPALGYATHAISSEDTPNAREGRDVVPGLASREYVEQCRIAWGESSPLYAVRVRGEFAAGADACVVPRALVERAMAQDAEASALVEHDAPLVLGVDVARFGTDATVIAPVRGNVALRMVEVRGASGPAVADAVVAVAREQRAPWQQRVAVAVDGIGVGASVVDALRARARDGVDVLDVNVSSAATNPAVHRNLRTELWFALRDWLASAVVVRDEALADDVCSATYAFDAQGRFAVDAKDDQRARIGRSPDRADALALAVHAARVAAHGTRRVVASAPRSTAGLGVWSPSSLRPIGAGRGWR